MHFAKRTYKTHFLITINDFLLLPDGQIVISLLTISQSVCRSWPRAPNSDSWPYLVWKIVSIVSRNMKARQQSLPKRYVCELVTSYSQSPRLNSLRK